MTDPAPLTDEELAIWEKWEPSTLIAALRAAHNALARVTAERDHWQRMYDIAKARADKAENLPTGDLEPIVDDSEAIP